MSLNQFQCNRFSGLGDSAQKIAIHAFNVRPLLRRDVVFRVRSRLVELCESGLYNRQEGSRLAAVDSRQSRIAGERCPFPSWRWRRYCEQPMPDLPLGGNGVDSAASQEGRVAR